MDICTRKDAAAGSPRNSHDRRIAANIFPERQPRQIPHQSLVPDTHPNEATNQSLRQRIIPPLPLPSLTEEPPQDPDKMASSHPPQTKLPSAIPTQSMDARPPRSESSINLYTTTPFNNARINQFHPAEHRYPRISLHHPRPHTRLPQPRLALRNLRIYTISSGMGHEHRSARNKRRTTSDLLSAGINLEVLFVI